MNTDDDSLRTYRLTAADERQRAGQLTLGRLLGHALKLDLDPLNWKVATTGVLVGTVPTYGLNGAPYTLDEALAVHQAWCTAFGAVQGVDDIPSTDGSAFFRSFRLGSENMQAWQKGTQIVLQVNWHKQ